ncbi:MAG: hypothetical protein IPK82_29460 [Polyangiaceae bacterium]|nr:hypothetical protein [Polyangiaceae bacterium]
MNVEADIMCDIHVHDRMKECCRATLQKLDKARSAGLRASGNALGSKSKSTLFEELGSLPIPRATHLVQQMHDTRSPLLQVSPPAREKWEAIVQTHVKKHQAAGESLEALFWSALGKPLEVIDLSLHPDLNKQLADRLNGKNAFSLPGDGGKKDEDLVAKVKGLVGNKLDYEDRQILFKIHGGDGKPAYWIGVGQPSAFSPPKPPDLGLPQPIPAGEPPRAASSRYWGIKLRVAW